ncbi:MAG: prolipoprotein diacylglyceryl transferase family protein [Roseiflexaceae bacterium]|jgi:prolipoprotein diacylglyceryltransferase
MMPLVSLGPIRMSTAGLLTLAALALWWWWGERRLIARDIKLPDWVFMLTIVATWIGARIWAVIAADTPISLIWEQLTSLRILDFAWPGAVIGGSLALWWSARKLNADWREWVSVLAMPTLIAFALSAFGSFWSGADAGRSWTGPFAVEMLGTLRHPVQLYETVLYLIGFGWCWWVERHRIPGGWWHLVAVIAMNILAVASFREQVVVLAGGIVLAQIIALLILIVAIERVMMVRRTTS